MITKDLTGERVLTYCILDPDYHSQPEIEKRLEEARRCGIQLHVWTRKEIENYLLVPAAIARVISASAKERPNPPDASAVREQIDSLAHAMRDAVVDGVAQALWEECNRGKGGPKSCNPLARERVDKAFQTHAGRIAMVPGKQILKGLAEWSRRSFGVSFDPVQVARELHRIEIDPEVASVIGAIERLEPFS